MYAFIQYTKKTLFKESNNIFFSLLKLYDYYNQQLRLDLIMVAFAKSKLILTLSFRDILSFFNKELRKKR